MSNYDKTEYQITVAKNMTSELLNFYEKYKKDERENIILKANLIIDQLERVKKDLND